MIYLYETSIYSKRISISSKKVNVLENVLTFLHNFFFHLIFSTMKTIMETVKSFLLYCDILFFYFFVSVVVVVVVHSLVSRVLINNVGILGDRRASKRGVSVRANSVHEPTVKNRTSLTHTYIHASQCGFFLYFVFYHCPRAKRRHTVFRTRGSSTK